MIMKKLFLLLIPISLWIATYQIWKVSVSFLQEGVPNGIQGWWILSDIFILILTGLSMILVGAILVDEINK